MSTLITRERQTKETTITASLEFKPGNLELNTPLPFLNHMLHALLFHGNWSGSIQAEGDIEVDYHHLVEDVGIALGGIFSEYFFNHQPLKRFGHAVIPMDDALGECSVDFSNRSYLNYRAEFPQQNVGSFDMCLCREFFTALAHNARVNLHIEARYGINSHHIAEALFKATGKAISLAFQPSDAANVLSTKGML